MSMDDTSFGINKGLSLTNPLIPNKQDNHFDPNTNCVSRYFD